MEKIFNNKRLKIGLFSVLGLLFTVGLVFAGYKLGQKQTYLDVIDDLTPAPPVIPFLASRPETDCQKLETLDMEALTEVSEIDCQKCEGKWGQLSMDLNMMGCNPKTSDSGEKCTDSQQCIGVCLGEKSMLSFGACSDFKFILGCNLEFSEGRQVELCRD